MLYIHIDLQEVIFHNYLLELGWDAVDWIGLVQDRNRWGALVNSV
jgi:hypothetical protein